MITFSCTVSLFDNFNESFIIAMKPNMMSVFAAFVFFHLLSIATINISFCNGRSTYVGCLETERKALLSFKQDLTDPSNRLASWNGDGDCCNWTGVVCDNFTGHVLQLRLQNPIEFSVYKFFTSPDRTGAEYEAYLRSQLGGRINPSLLDLKHLIHLDLRKNSFLGFQIPGFLGSLENLRYLDLSHAGFMGTIPQQLGNLSNLQYLDLNSYSSVNIVVAKQDENLSGLQSPDLSSSNFNNVQDFMWVSGLFSLKHLDLSGVNLSVAFDLLPQVSSFPSLEVLKLSSCELQHFDHIGVANFSSLTTLDLSSNKFNNPLIPNWVFGLSGLDFLDLSSNGFQGPIPDGLGNLSTLRHLDLFSNHFNSSLPKWLSRFSRLEYLSLYSSDLQGSISSALGNMTSLKALDLSNTGLEGIIPTSFERLCNLRSISMSFTSLNSNISEVLDIFSKCVSATLELLDFSNCQLSGLLTDQLGQFKNLETLDLSNNSISGHIPSSLGELSSLRKLDLSHNKLNGTLSQIHFNNLTRLVDFKAFGNSQIVVKVNSNWVPPFQLRILKLRSCHMGPHFPSWLRSQKNLTDLDISNNGISDIIPDWFWKSLSQYRSLNLSHNQIHHTIPNLIDGGQIETLDLSSNKFFGPLPHVSVDVKWILDLSNNALTGSVSTFFCSGMDESKTTKVLNLGNNSLSGELPNCWMNWRNLMVLNLGHNEFTGSIPTSIGNLSSLQSLILRKNSLTGVIPVSLEKCTILEVLNAAANHFVGNVPTWIGERFPRLKLLILRSNKFDGHLPLELCQLSSLQILDLAHNNLTGNIPSCINNFSAMVTVDHSERNDLYYLTGDLNVRESVFLVWKGIEYEYSSILNLLRVIDLSKNNFSGEIPREVTSLLELQSLNFSHNSFSGRIPQKIGAMRQIESIDLSTNQLSGEIPQSISSLTFLSRLNFSSNNLSGKIPLSTQIQSLEASSFTGNDLCGPPLPDCKDNVGTPEHENGGKDGNEHGMDWFWFYVSMAPGFVVGFWGFIGPLLINRRWRYVYWGFLDRLEDKLYFATRKCF
ncbi:hypothetical protein Ddye_027488 [Dipteronia dyeriana]|uniref:Leucine-rich repeat-containing N-terminal plant-type domain-containing protein n=1 Tax=Dipteronia dyeriana TaxID=168575 RepID=A0AAD9WRF8_9ROSI|nr:hypothetical protein Ddye_027488 [Dipteronia dyeriana]